MVPAHYKTRRCRLLPRPSALLIVRARSILRKHPYLWYAACLLVGCGIFLDVVHSTGHIDSNKIHNIYARMPGALLPRARPCRSTLPDMPEAAALDGLHGRVDTGRFGRRDQLMQNARRTASGRLPVPSLLWPQPLKRLYYRHLPVVEHPYYYIPHLIQTPKEGVGCGRPDPAPFCLYGV